ncbi:hypothetical protein GCM10027598_74830 [Amycolatopsis oliviviridis]|uniref:Secreted protein n=1 Tax=Amycolatopsis oliviviridis TaxID=1471590 RepID=A0ABQ3L4D8_9PSEU|nr:hypothetical protein [Amycolatopsis oliviviridis]GHH03135.1 hypothetical protein GCM10017790_04770 [Amycolatopsis oliviviridis]
MSTELLNRTAKVVLPLLVAAGAAVAAPAAASAAPGPGIQSLASCKTHYANTAAWMDCTGGSQASWVRLGAHCATGWYYSDWYSVQPRKKRTVSYECTWSVSGAKAEIRRY